MALFVHVAEKVMKGPVSKLKMYAPICFFDFVLLGNLRFENFLVRTLLEMSQRLYLRSVNAPIV